MQNDLDVTNAQRTSQQLGVYPDINEVWSIRESPSTVPSPSSELISIIWTTAEMYKKESRILNRLETQRGFLPLKEYLAKTPSDLTNDSHFPPKRDIFLPSEFLTGWRIYARRFGRQEDLTVKSKKVRRKSGPAKGRARKKLGGGDSEEEDEEE